MVSASIEVLTGLLQAWGRGDREARDRLFPLVYEKLRRLAAYYLRRERPGHILGPTDLVHEVYLRLAGQRRAAWRNPGQFFAVAARTMRRILAENARARMATKREGGWVRVDLEDTVAVSQQDPELLTVSEALNDLSALDPQRALIVDLRFFGGLSIEETAGMLGISPATVKRDWSVARTWLHGRISHMPSHRPEMPLGNPEASEQIAPGPERLDVRRGT
jgi:RNA polymerase sigma-70 factor, ECF subfamily